MKSLKNFYDNYHKKNAFYGKVISDNNFTYFYMLQFLQEGNILLSNLKILDIGCGVGTVSLYLGSKGAQVKGFDLSSRAIEIANKAKEKLKMKNVTFHQGEVKFGKGKYDLIICSEVIEHIPDDTEFVKIIKSNLKQDGHLFLTTPLKSNLLFKIGFYKKFDKQVGHLRRYTKKSIIQLIEKNGLTVITAKQIEGPLRNILFTTKLGFFIKFIRGPFVQLFHSIDRLFLKIFGASNILIYAKK